MGLQPIVFSEIIGASVIAALTLTLSVNGPQIFINVAAVDTCTVATLV